MKAYDGEPMNDVSISETETQVLCQQLAASLSNFIGGGYPLYNRTDALKDAKRIVELLEGIPE